MTFYNTNNQEISQIKWIEKIQPYYYLSGPTHGRRVNRRNQGSRFVEEKIEKILKNGLQPNDLPLIIAWKIGAIDHKASEFQKIIFYKNNFDQEFQTKGQFRQINANDIINYCKNNFDYLINLNDDVERLFNNLYQNRGLNNGFGIVYCMSLLYFFTQGNWPIYDKYAQIALDAIFLNKRPGEIVRYRQINSWRDYCEKYVNKMVDVFDNQNIPREIDRSLWVYGHFFKS